MSDQQSLHETLLELGLQHPVVILPSGSPGAPDDEAPAGRFADYLEVREINRGGMGVILVGRDPGTNRRVAIKTLQRSLADSPHLVRKFLEEAQVCAQLEHPNIVPVHEVGRTPEGELYFSMKRVEGRSLAELIAQDALSLPELLRVLLKACDGVAFAHSRGVVHRDLKPANVMVGQFGEVLVMDWGLAKVLGRDDAPDPVVTTDSTVGAGRSDSGETTMPGSVLGTPQYMPPEQARGGLIDARSDIYALGATLYHGLTGSAPFTADSALGVLDQVKAGELVPPADRVPEREIPRELEAVVLKAMALDPGERYQTVQSLQTDVEAFLGGRTLAAAEYTPLQRARKWIARHRGLTSAVAALVILAVVGAGVARWMRERALVRQRQADAEAAMLLGRRLLESAPLEEALASQYTRRVAQRKQRPDLQEDASEASARDEALRTLLGAVAALDRAMALGASGEQVRALRRRAGRALGWVALLGQDFTLAERAYRDLADHGEPSGSVRALVARVEQARNAGKRWRADRLAAILADLRGGLDRPGRGADAPDLNEYIFEALNYREPQTIELLAEALRPLTERAARLGVKARWTDRERVLARFCTTVLGRLGLEEAVEPLARWIVRLHDGDLLVEAGQALGNTRSARANRPLVATAARLGWQSTVWRRISPAFRRLPRSDEAPRSADEWFRAAVVRHHRGDIKGAVAAYSRAIELDPRAYKSYNDRGLARRALGDLEGAIEDLDRAIQLNRKFDKAWFSRALVRMEQGLLRKAREDVSVGIGLNARYAEAYHLRGQINVKMKRRDLALADFSRSIKLDESNAEVYLSRGLLRARMGRRDLALRDLSRALLLEPGRSACWRARASVHLQMGNRAGALTDLGRAIALDPTHSRSYLERAKLRRLERDLDGALADMDRLVELRPESGEFLSHRGYLRHQAGQHTRARADLAAALKLEPRNPKVRLRRGLVEQGHRRYRSALAEYDAALGLDPKYVEAYNNRGLCHRALRNEAAAMADFARVLRLAPTHYEARYNRATGLLRRQDNAGALAEMNLLVEHHPTRPLPYLVRAQLRARAGQREAAIADCRKFLTIAPKSPYRKTIEQLLRKLRAR